MKARGPKCPALAIWKPGDVEVLACVDQGCCGWEQHKAEAGGSVAPSWLCRVQRAPELCTAQQVWCGGLQPSSLHPSPCRGQAASLCLLLFGYTTWSPSSAPVLLVCDLFLPWSGHSVGGHSLWQKSTSPRVEFKCTKQNIWCEES